MRGSRLGKKTQKVVHCDARGPPYHKPNLPLGGQSSFQDCTNKCVASPPLQYDVPVSTTPSVVIVNFGLFCIHFTQFSLYKTSRG